ncbi:MAG: purine-nucleoside phosphorylase, partial [Acidimicrobiales bacterium]|nr:purine-nucleoside phosphorylase [Acidimicrobiales bacterium]
MSTPHIEAEMGDFAPVVLMPGDPLRATYIAEQHLEDARLVTNIRNASGYTGTYEGVRVSVMTSGMGMPSAAIYMTELYRFYGVETIIRVGTAGVFDPSLELRSIVAATECITNSSLPGHLLPNQDFLLTPTQELVTMAVRIANQESLDLV